MTNSPRQNSYHKPRYTDDEAYELLPHMLKAMLQESIQDFNSYSVLKWYRKYGIEECVRLINS